MNKKKLAIELSKLRPLKTLNINLEQYQTESEIAAELLWRAYMNGDIKDKHIIDLGCGNGILGAGALLLGAKKIYFLDKDKEAIEICKKNTKEFGNTEYYNLEVEKFEKKADTALMNPPFGVQNRKADKSFLIRAMKLSDNIYSIHKIESKKFIEKICEENNFIVKDIIKTKFLIKRTYKFHTKDKYYVNVGIWHLTKLK